MLNFSAGPACCVYVFFPTNMPTYCIAYIFSIVRRYWRYSFSRNVARSLKYMFCKLRFSSLPHSSYRLILISNSLLARLPCISPQVLNSITGVNSMSSTDRSHSTSCHMHSTSYRGNPTRAFGIYTNTSTYQWPSARLQYLHCVSNGDTTVLH